MRLLCTGLLLAALSAVDVQAQNPQVREGFGISFGVGGGSAGLSCDFCSSDRDNGFSGYLRIGGHVRPNLFVGGETNGWYRSELGVDTQIGFVTAVVQWYPQPASGFFLKGGAGFASASAEDSVDEATATGLGLTAGLGYDWRVSKNFSLSPYVNYLRSVGAEASFNGVGTGTNLNVDVFQFGLGFTWH